MVFFVMTWTTATAHVSHIEPQAVRNQATCQQNETPENCNADLAGQRAEPELPDEDPVGWGNNTEDFSFEFPFVMAPTFDTLTGSPVLFCEHGRTPVECLPASGPNIEVSKSIHAYLSAAIRDDDHPGQGQGNGPPGRGEVEGDVDWYRFVLDENELSFPNRGNSRGIPPIAAGSALVSANALPWRCADYTNSLPTVALIGPGLGLDVGAHDLPTEVMDALFSPLAIAEDWGIFVAEDDTQHPTPRSSIHFDGINTDWWGGNPATTFFDGELNDEFRGGLWDGNAVTTPGTYHIVVWDPNGKALDYSLSTGFLEERSENEDILGDGTRLIWDNDNMLDIMCNDPCDGSTREERKDIGDESAGTCGPVTNL
jgi:hypothetical protein